MDYKNKKFLNDIFEASYNSNLIIFLGAGISVPIGVPLWNQLANDLLKMCCYNNYIDYFEKERILSKVDNPVELVSIAGKLFEKNKNSCEFQSKMISFLKLDKKSGESDDDYNKRVIRINDVIDKITGLSEKIVTTNADKLFDDKLTPFYKLEDLSIENFKSHNQAVFHIHGSIDDENTLVFTRKQYIERYNFNKDFKNFLSDLFSDPNYTFLFIGYSFRDTELLSYIINDDIKKRSKMYLLKEYFKKDTTLYLCEKDYYKELGLTLISYPLDKGFGYLFDTVLKETNDSFITFKASKIKSKVSSLTSYTAGDPYGK